MDRKIKLISDEKFKRVDIFLSSKIDDISRSEIKKLIKEGKLKVNEKIIKKPGLNLLKGDKIEMVIPNKKKSEIIPQNIKLNIIYEDNSIIVIDKEPGMVVHPGAGNYTGTLVNALLAIRPEISKVGGEKRPGIVHRLDKDTSGVLVIAKNNKTYLDLQKQFSERIIKKKYILIVKGVFDKKRGKIDIPIGRSRRDRKKISSNTSKSRNALTFYKVLYQKKGFSLVEATPKTGRTHQLRVHFSEIGKPIIGDIIYGASTKKMLNRLALHSKEIMIFHPEKHQYYKFITKTPPLFFNFFRKL